MHPATINDFLTALIVASTCGIALGWHFIVWWGPYQNTEYKRGSMTFLASVLAAIGVFAFYLDLLLVQLSIGQFWVMVGVTAVCNEFVRQIVRHSGTSDW